ncbi:MAG: XRE family transcriptional regulator [Patescibacteria group bacterium]
MQNPRYLPDDLRHKILETLSGHDIMVVGPLTVHSDHDGIRKFYDDIVAVCEKAGRHAYNAHKYTDPIKHPEITPEEVYIIDKKLVSNVRLVLAYIGEPSSGTGQELEIAEVNDIPVIVLYEKGKRISRMVLGNPTIIDKIEFSNYEDALKQVEYKVEDFFSKNK